MKHKINVSREDIREAVQEDPRACMVWRAVVRNLQLETEGTGQPVEVFVDYSGLSLTGPQGQVYVRHDEDLTSKIKDFDVKKSLVKPFEFELELPDDWREQVQGMAHD